MDDKRLNLLKNEKISKAINTLAAPAIVGMLVMAIYNVVDSIFVSWISDQAIAATQVVLPVMLIASAIGLAFGIGGGSYVSRLLGMEDTKKANNVVSVVFFTGLVVGIIVIVLNLIYIDPVLQFFGANEEILGLAKAYGRYIIIGYAFIIVNMIMNNSLRSEGSATYSMIGMASGSILNIILDPILIFGFNMGIEGAAIATTISQVVSTVVLLSFYFRKKTLLKISIAYFKPTIDIYKQIIVIGVPTFFRQMLMSVSIGLLNTAAITYGGTELLAALGVVTRVTMIPNYIVFGYGQGFQPVVGYNFGSKNKERVMESFWYALKIQMIILAVAFVLLNIFNKTVFVIYQSSPEVTAYGMIAMRWYTVGILFLGISNTIAVFYQALGRGLEALVLSIARQGFFFIPLILYLPTIFDANGVMMTQAVCDLFTFVLAVGMIIPFFSKSRLQKWMET